MNAVILGKIVRHQMCTLLADRALDMLEDHEILEKCPPEYGLEVGDNHRSLMWDALYEREAGREDQELLDLFVNEMYMAHAGLGR